MTKTVNKTMPALPDLSRSMNAILQAWGPLGEYMTDAMQRTILYWDVLRQRSDQYYAQKAKAVPHVLNFDAELVLDARTFKRPVNYLLVHVNPPEGVTINPRQRPFVVVDPRAGHNLALAVSRPIANSVSPCAPAIPVTSSVSPRADAWSDD